VPRCVSWPQPGPDEQLLSRVGVLPSCTASAWQPHVPSAPTALHAVCTPAVPGVCRALDGARHSHRHAFSLVVQPCPHLPWGFFVPALQPPALQASTQHCAAQRQHRRGVMAAALRGCPPSRATACVPLCVRDSARQRARESAVAPPFCTLCVPLPQPPPAWLGCPTAPRALHAPMHPGLPARARPAPQSALSPGPQGRPCPPHPRQVRQAAAAGCATEARQDAPQGVSCCIVPVLFVNYVVGRWKAHGYMFRSCHLPQGALPAVRPATPQRRQDAPDARHLPRSRHCSLICEARSMAAAA